MSNFFDILLSPLPAIFSDLVLGPTHHPKERFYSAMRRTRGLAKARLECLNVVCLLSTGFFLSRQHSPIYPEFSRNKEKEREIAEQTEKWNDCFTRNETHLKLFEEGTDVLMRRESSLEFSQRYRTALCIRNLLGLISDSQARRYAPHPDRSV